ncbi:hypothetical protein TVAG_293360 [Trichomonas vaginalis G3]|uniref:Uncharacterized protein n=1 Tax=Trichomonas vaginalis (strain ATCC PRA-98 / G3) TaxID=412133 RepID=A2G4P2_TRIV3|nr:serine/threonine-protein phosphatase 6 regulatory subunit family [Trichomonas vaginalis G3]EAX87873.1 hypothetical protein TVAG_293360 [Trichomonas vaginalis G3]KAI5531119.1 serine/threonine-protein phosphatase 6 regulatory subunit family [Trichomonas vaginalis G3]|eukprot:XP_001300803.1 hypothetical protein [Trichomonas vaginalis G3]
MWGVKTKIDTLLEDPKVTVEELLKCDDIQGLYRMNSPKLVSFLTQPNTIKEMFNILKKSNNFQFVRKILGLHISPNTTIIHTIIESGNLVDSLLSVLACENEIHRYVTGAVASIVLKMFENWPRDTYNILSSTSNNYNRLIKASHIPGIFHLLNRFVTDSETQNSGKIFVWILYLSLMDEHGPGCKVPNTVVSSPCYNKKPLRLQPIHRSKCLELLCAYFNEFIDDSTDIFNAVNTGLPLLLQDSSDDHERAMVFKLGLTLNPNQVLGLAAVSIVNCFKSSDILLQYSLLYITAFEVNIGYKSIELFLYRLLSSKSYNNFVMIAASKMLASIIAESHDRILIENVKQIVGHCFQKESSLAMKSFRSSLLIATKGEEIDTESETSGDRVDESAFMFDRIKIDQSFISSLQSKANVIDQNKSFVPQFSVRELWRGDDIPKMEKLFRTLEKIDYTSKKAQQKPQSQQQKPKEQPKEQPPQRKPALRQIQSDDEEFALEEIEVTDPAPPQTQISFPPSPGRPFVEISSGSGPLTVQESTKEPRPLVEVPKDFKPIPKVLHLNPASPRVALRRNADPFAEKVSPRSNGSKKHETPNRKRPSPLKRDAISSDSDSDSEDSSSDDYEYEYVEIDEDEQDEIMGKAKKNEAPKKDEPQNIQKVREMIYNQLSKSSSENSKDVNKSEKSSKSDKTKNSESKRNSPKKSSKGKYNIEKVVDDMFIEPTMKKPTLNRRVLVVEVPERVVKLKVCLLDCFDDLSSVMAPSEDKTPKTLDPEPVSTKRRTHRHNSVVRTLPGDEIKEEKKRSHKHKSPQ